MAPRGIPAEMRILVVGAGIAGLSAAIRLREGGHEVVVMERSRELRTGGYMIDFFGPGYDAAERMGLLSDLAAIHYPIQHLVFVDRHGRTTADLPYPLVRRRLFGDRHFNFMRGDLETVLYERLVAAGGQVAFGTSPERLERDGGRIAIRESNGRHDRFDLVLGADGVHSFVRAVTLPATAWRLRELECHTAAFTLDGLIPGLPPDAFISMSAPGRTAAVYPIRGHRTATLFVYRTAAPPADRSRETCRQELERAFRGSGWVVDDILDALPNASDLYFDDVVQVEARPWSVGRTTLLGDACGCLSLVAGQGASMAMAGAYVLARELLESPNDVERAFTRYEARLRPAVAARQRAGRRGAAWFLPQSALAARLRDLGMEVAVRTPLAGLLARALAGAPLELD